MGDTFEWAIASSGGKTRAGTIGAPPARNDASGTRQGWAHNAYTARLVFGEAFIAKKRAARTEAKRESAQRDAFDKVLVALCHNGFSKREAKPVVDALRHEGSAPELVPLLRAPLGRLTPTRA